MVLVIDVGTSSLRGELFDRKGTLVWASQKEYELYTPSDGIVELNMSVLDRSLYDILKFAGEWLGEKKAKISCISVTAQRSSVIPVNKQGDAIRNALMWQDTRAESICKKIETKPIYQICGMRPSPVFSAPKMAFLKKNERSVYEKAYKLIGFQEYVLHRLTGEFVTDYSIASRTCLFDIRKQLWSKDLADMFGIGRDKLCRLIPVGAEAGHTKEEVARLLSQESKIPVISAGGDQQCAALGMGCIEEGEIVANSGTGSYVMAVTDQPVYDPDMRINCNMSAIPNQWILEGAVLSAGKTINWLNRVLFGQNSNNFDEFTRNCETSSAGAKGLLFIPTLAGKGTPDWNPEVRGSLIGLSFEHTSGDIARALLEGIAAEVKQCIEVLSELTGNDYQKIRIAGGITKNLLYNQIQADMYQKVVVKPKSDEATGLGAWISAAVHIGWYKNEKKAYETAVEKFQETEFLPENMAGNVYKEVYKKLRQYEKRKKPDAN